MPKHQIIYITAPVEVANQIAETLVGEKLARCVNVQENIKSIYRWEDQVERATESMLIAKTMADKTEDLIAKVQEIHPYEVPEIIIVDITGGNKDYLDWLDGKEIVVDEPDLEEELVEDEEDLAEDDEEKEEAET